MVVMEEMQRKMQSEQQVPVSVSCKSLMLELLHFTPCQHVLLLHLNNATLLPTRYTFEYPASWKNDVVNKVRQLCSNAAKHGHADKTASGICRQRRVCKA